MKIHQLIWSEDRIDHIALHGIEPEKEVCFGQAWCHEPSLREKIPSSMFWAKREKGGICFAW